MIKQLTSIIFLLLSNITILNAQQYISIGPAVGIGHSNLTNTNIDKTFNPVFSAGLSGIYAKHEHWGFGADIMYSKEGAKFDIVNTDPYTYVLDYLRINPKVYYFFGSYKSTIRPKVFVGPSIGINLGEKNNAPIQTLPHYPTKGLDLGIFLGGGVNFRIKSNIWLNTDINFYQGFLDATNYINDANLNQKIQLQVGVLFGLGK
jgi:outer membrane protein W